MTLSRTRVVDTLIVLLTVAVVGLSILPWLVPRVQESMRGHPDSGRVLAAMKAHQAVIDAERTDAEEPKRPSVASVISSPRWGFGGGMSRAK